MKKRIMCLSAALLSVMLLTLLSVSALAASQPDAYSSSANSGERGVVCTTLLGTGASEYYTEENRYEALAALSEDELLSALRELVTGTHTYISTYEDCKNYSVNTDCQNEDGTVVLIYTSYAASFSDFDGSSPGWNREHIWPKSLGGFGNSGAGADLHHIRPSNVMTNSKRGNLLYGEVTGGSAANGDSLVNYASGGTRNGTYFEPHDSVKGDVARICLYVYLRYGTTHSDCADITNVFESVETLLSWCALDPVDTWEMGRNEVVESIQGNRNVFIDYPELAWLLFDEELPYGMVTPSGEALKAAPACAHKETEIRNATEASCQTVGYTGDIYCVDCGERITAGSELPKSNHTFGAWEQTAENAEERVCTVCAASETRVNSQGDASVEDEGVQTADPAVILAAVGAVLLLAIVFVIKKKR